MFDLANKKGSEENPERMQDEQSTNKVKKRKCVLWLALPDTQHLVTGPGATFFLEPCQTRFPKHPHNLVPRHLFRSLIPWRCLEPALQVCREPAPRGPSLRSEVPLQVLLSGGQKKTSSSSQTSDIPPRPAEPSKPSNKSWVFTSKTPRIVHRLSNTSQASETFTPKPPGNTPPIPPKPPQLATPPDLHVVQNRTFETSGTSKTSTNLGNLRNPDPGTQCVTAFWSAPAHPRPPQNL